MFFKQRYTTKLAASCHRISMNGVAVEPVEPIGRITHVFLQGIILIYILLIGLRERHLDRCLRLSATHVIPLEILGINVAALACLQAI